MSFKHFLQQNTRAISTGEDGLTIYHKRVFRPKGWDVDLRHFYDALPNNFVFSQHYYKDHKEREKLNIEKKHLGTFDQFKDGAFEFKYDNGRMVGATVDLKNLHNTEEFKYIADKTQNYAYPIMNIDLIRDKNNKMIRDFSTYKKVGFVKTIFNAPKATTIKVNPSNYSHDPNKGKIR